MLDTYYCKLISCLKEAHSLLSTCDVGDIVHRNYDLYDCYLTSMIDDLLANY